MTRIFTIAAALGAALLPAPALLAQAPAEGYYTAVPVATPARTSFVTRTAAWRLSNGALVANRAPERDMVLCQLVAARAGELQSFSVAGRAYGAEDLAKCNARVKRAAAPLPQTTAAR